MKEKFSNLSIARSLAGRTGMRVREAGEFLRAVTIVFIEMMGEGKEINLYRFGTFRLRYRKARKVLPKTLLKSGGLTPAIQAARYTCKFMPGAGIRKTLRKVPIKPEDEEKAKLRVSRRAKETL